MSKRDLCVVVADLDAEKAIGTLLGKRQKALGIQLDFDPSSSPPRGDLLRFAKRDSGCYQQAADILRGAQRTHQRGLLIFDRHGCGVQNKNREQIESEVETNLKASGWDENQVSVVVIEPELEMWVWADSPQVAQVLGWHDEPGSLRPFLHRNGLWTEDKPKPNDPKAALEKAVREKRRRKPTAPMFTELATKVSVQGCQDPAFVKLYRTLTHWFGDHTRNTP